MKKESYYFSHDSSARNDEKILELRMDLGWEGYGIYWALIEMLREANAYQMRTQYKRIAFGLQVPEDTVKSIIEDYGLFKIKDDVLYSESLNHRMELKEAKSKQAREAALKSWESRRNKKDESESNADALQKESDSNAIKEKEIKEKEILIDNISSKEFRERTIKFLNKTLGSSFRDSTQQTKKDLKKIWEEKYTLQEVGKMIVYKHQEWKDNKDMSKYLVPSTLFRFSNFEKYVEASRNFKPKKEESFYRSASNPQSGQFC